jgi:hypothetical protein
LPAWCQHGKQDHPTERVLYRFATESKQNNAERPVDVYHHCPLFGFVLILFVFDDRGEHRCTSSRTSAPKKGRASLSPAHTHTHTHTHIHTLTHSHTHTLTHSTGRQVMPPPYRPLATCCSECGWWQPARSWRACHTPLLPLQRPGVLPLPPSGLLTIRILTCWACGASLAPRPHPSPCRSLPCSHA